MEKTFDEGPAMKNQDENLNSCAYGAAAISSVKNEVFELHNGEHFKKNIVSGDTKVSEDGEFPLFNKESSENVSPTLLESAFNVMKTFFSPDKAKYKVSNSVNQQKIISESTSNSCRFPNKEKPRSSEPENEISTMKAAFSEEYDLKDKKQLPTPFLSPLTFELQSNDDDSFLTTVSYDESFQSAVTHFDEYGEVTKNCDNLSNNIFNNSQDLHLADSCNSSLENSECCLENTMLKNDSTSSKEINHNDFSIKNTAGNNECFNSDKNIDHNNVEVSNADCSYQASAVPIENFQANGLNSGGFITLNDISNKLDSYESNVNTETKILNREKQIKLQNTEPGIQELITLLESSECLSNNVDFMKAIQKNKIFCNEKINGSFTEMTNNINTDDKLAVAAEKIILQNSPESFSSQLSKSDLNKVDEILLALKKDSGSVTALNSINGNACFLKTSDDIHMKKMQTPEYAKPERSISPDINELDKSKECLNQNILNKCLDHFQEIQPSLVSSLINHNKETEKLIESPTLCFENGLRHPIMHSSFTGSTVDVAPSSDISTEKESDNETMKLFAKNVENNFPLKHSTPVSVLSNNCSMCSNIQTHDLNSLEIGQRNDEEIIDEFHNARCEFLSGTMGSPHSEESSNLFVKNLNIKSNPVTPGESISPAKGVLSSEPNECGQKSADEVGKLTEIVKGDSGFLIPSGPNLAHETKSDSLGQKEERLELPVFNQTFDKKSESFNSENLDLNKIMEVQGPVKLNHSENLEISAIANKIYNKVSDSEEPNKLNLTFDKKTESVKSEKNELFSFNEQNDTCVKESNKEDLGYDADDGNKISEKSFNLGFISDKERSELTEPQEADNFLSPIKELPEPTRPPYYVSINESLTENINDKRNDGIYFNNENHSFLSESFSPSSNSENSSMLKNQILASSDQVTEKLNEKLIEMQLNDVPSEVLKELPHERIMQSESRELPVANSECIRSSELCSFSKNIEPDIAQLIEQQFTPTDIAKICDIANLPVNLSSLSLKENENESETDIKVKNLLSPKSFDFLNNIQGKSTGRDLSRESLYVKFDPLVQPPSANSLIDFTKEVEALAASETSPAHHSASICEELLAISPERTSDAIVPPLTPLSDRNKRDKIEKQKELQNEIYFLKNLYSERERVNKTKMEDYESQIAKLTGDKCVMEDKLKEYSEREKSLVKKMSAQTHDIEQLKLVMKEYVKVISLLTAELETMRKENAQQIEALTLEKDSYMNHLQNTEAAFSDVHAKYEKSKKTIESLKKNEVMYRNTISEHAHKMEEYKKKTKEAQERAVSEFQSIMLELDESKNSHSQEVSRLRAQLKKTELKLEAVQESLDQKIKENEQLTAICDELIEGKK